MRARLRRLSSLLRIEFGVSWRFPILEGLAAILFFGFLLNTTRFGFHEDFSTGNAQQIPNFLDGLAPHYLYNGMMSFNSLVLLAPILVAIAVARPFEDGFYRTHLTLPVKRLTLLVTKAGLVILILATLHSDFPSTSYSCRPFLSYSCYVVVYCPSGFDLNLNCSTNKKIDYHCHRWDWFLVHGYVTSRLRRSPFTSNSYPESNDGGN